MAGWLVVLLVSAVAIGVCAVTLFAVGIVGARLRVSDGPVVVAGRVVFSVLLVAVLLLLVSGLWGLIEMLLTRFHGG